jgi:acyl dehydratase
MALAVGTHGWDCNPLHSDPEFAATAGLPRPTRPSSTTCSTADMSQGQASGARFAGVMFPGETLRAIIWNTARDSPV